MSRLKKREEVVLSLYKEYVDMLKDLKEYFQMKNLLKLKKEVLSLRHDRLQLLLKKHGVKLCK